MEILNLQDRSEIIEAGIDYFWKCWGNEENYKFYEDCILNASKSSKTLPRFYVMIKGGNIIGSYALLTNDLISRQDLMPWLACLFVNPDERGKGYSSELLSHGLMETAKLGFKELFLNSELINFYEKKGWEYSSDGYNVTGEKIKIYKCKV
jgi:N-acetylglutamate synthase-like GNAT family acetyltransferase